jgi:hypothetical protein
MARFCDEQADAHGEVERKKEDLVIEEEASDSAQASSNVGKELADKVAAVGGDCCVPKKKI